MLEHLIEIGCILLIAPIASVLKSTGDGLSCWEDNCMVVMVVQAITSIVLILIGIGVSLKG
ncbi:MAG: hypothetical protein E6104_02690 [Veillonella sp.]|nr:hypothetical protein [Veillonella sp.]